MFVICKIQTAVRKIFEQPMREMYKVHYFHTSIKVASVIVGICILLIFSRAVKYFLLFLYDINYMHVYFTFNRLSQFNPTEPLQRHRS